MAEMKRFLICSLIIWAFVAPTWAQAPDSTRRSIQLELPLPPATKSKTTVDIPAYKIPGTQGGVNGAPVQQGQSRNPQPFYQPSPVVAPPAPSTAGKQTIPFQYTPVGNPGQMQAPGYSPTVNFGNGAGVSGPGFSGTQNSPNALQFASLTPVSGGFGDSYSHLELSDFTGGLNLVDFPNRIADNQAVEITNFVWSPSGKLKARPGFKFRKGKSTSFGGANRIWGLYNYYAPNNRNIVLAGINGTLYADTNETGTYVSIAGGLQSNSKYYDFETFKGGAVVVHEGDYPFIYNATKSPAINRIFGLADSFYVQHGWIGYTDPCTTYYQGYGTNWDIDQWAGYILSDARNPSTTSGWVRQIAGNDVNTLILRNAQSGLSYWDDGQKLYVSGFFDYDSVGAGTLDSVITTYPLLNCPYKHYYVNGTVSADWDNYPYVMRMTSGPDAGEERIIISAVASPARLRPQSPFDSTTGLLGESYIVKKKTWWKALQCQVYKNRLFMVVKNNYPTSNEEIVVFSNYNSLSDFAPNNFFTVKTQDGDHITALATLYDDQLGYKDESKDCLLIFKNNSIWKLMFNSETDYALVQVSPTVGCIAPKSIATVEGNYLLFLHRSGVYAWDGRIVKPVSGLIDTVITTIMDSPYAQQAAGVYHDNHYYLAFRDSIQGEYGPYGAWRCMALNTTFGGWLKEQNIGTWMFTKQTNPQDSNEVLFVDGNDQTKVYEFDNRILTDTNETIGGAYTSKAFDFNSIDQDKRFTSLDFDYYMPDSGVVNVGASTDFGAGGSYSTTFYVGSGYGSVHIPFNSTCIGKNLTFAISGSPLIWKYTKGFEFGKVSIEYKKLKE